MSNERGADMEAAAPDELVRYREGGSVGVGTSTPDAKLEIVGLSLHKALEQLVSQESSAFSFVPPQSSLAHIQSYLENSGGVGVNTSPPA